MRGGAAGAKADRKSPGGGKSYVSGFEASPSFSLRKTG